MSKSKLFTSLLIHRKNAAQQQWLKFTNHNQNYVHQQQQLQRFDQLHCLSNSSSSSSSRIERIHVPFSYSVGEPVGGGDFATGRVDCCNVNSVCRNAAQKRGFFSFGNDEEGDVLSKVYEEKRVIGYSQEQVFNVVAAVDMYHDFVPWCQRSEIIKHYPDGSFDAELEIGFKFLVESYVSHVEFEREKFVKSTVSKSSLFDHLINVWEFKPGPVPGTCDLYFMVDFKFQSQLYRQVASIFFKEVVSRLVGSLNDRCRIVYGPGVPILEKPY